MSSLALVFDLDDTLYKELSFVKSGFEAVADFLRHEYKLPESEALDFMMVGLKDGRGKIFNNLLERYGILNATLVRKCLSVYRTHIPRIALYPDALRCLERFREYPKYIVTDGNTIVQRNKIRALNLNGMVKRCFVTHHFGRKHAKPSPYCFEVICRVENTAPGKVIYVGDDPNKDFVGIKPCGFRTIRVLRGNYRSLRLPPEFEADHEVLSLDEVTTALVEELGK